MLQIKSNLLAVNCLVCHLNVPMGSKIGAKSISAFGQKHEGDFWHKRRTSGFLFSKTTFRVQNVCQDHKGIICSVTAG